ncbi:MAG: hypothetical protein K9K37_11290, partial [Desulfocapsa sp.]|nr:hypothetical protein [Desulfocapsa sp.]
KFLPFDSQKHCPSICFFYFGYFTDCCARGGSVYLGTSGSDNIGVQDNIFGRLLSARNGNIGHSLDARWEGDHQALLELFEDGNYNELRFAICREDAMEEFVAFSPEKIKSYSSIVQNLPEHMLKKWEFFNQIEGLPLMIAPYGDYGFGCGPFGGGNAKDYKLLSKIKEALGMAEETTSQKERDARHLLHAVLHKCDVFLTMDYKTIVAPLQPVPKMLDDALCGQGLKLRVMTPVELLEKISYRCSQDQ